MRSVIAVVCAASLLVVQTPTMGFAQGLASGPAQVMPTVSPAKAAEHRALSRLARIDLAACVELACRRYSDR